MRKWKKCIWANENRVMGENLGQGGPQYMELEGVQFKDVEFKILLNILYKDFYRYMDAKNNNRIFFSGKYGTGKTTFLRDFFEAHKDKYLVFHLFPIYYQILPTENITDYIKADILVELIEKHGVKDENTLSALGILLILKEGLNVLENIPMLNPLIRLGKFSINIANLVFELKKVKKGTIEKYLEQYRKIKDDPISQTIQEKVRELKKGKKSILIIDDLDRLDPDHIFRILNSFSIFLGLDKEETEINKNFLGFDKVIFVGDIRNIQSIFHHRYGQEADFEGYFDRFYSYNIYEFKLEKITDYIVSELYKHIYHKTLLWAYLGDVEKSQIPINAVPWLEPKIVSESDFSKNLLGIFMQYLINTEYKEYKLTFRKLKKLMVSGDLLLAEYNKYAKNSQYFEQLIFILTFLRELLGGDNEKLISVIEMLKEYYLRDNSPTQEIDELIIQILKKYEKIRMFGPDTLSDYYRKCVEITKSEKEDKPHIVCFFKLLEKIVRKFLTLK